jgi:hypothetical protein
VFTRVEGRRRIADEIIVIYPTSSLVGYGYLENEAELPGGFPRPLSDVTENSRA